jgi:hypothetical protein
VIALSLSELQRNRVIVQSELADDLPPITGDRVQLQQPRRDAAPDLCFRICSTARCVM